MIRSVKISRGFLTAKKNRYLDAIVEAFQAATNFYIRKIWADPTGCDFDGKTLALLDKGRTRLTERQKSQALKCALETVVGTKRSARELGVLPSRPVYRGPADLDAKNCTIKDGTGAFDLVIEISRLKCERPEVPGQKRKLKRLDKLVFVGKKTEMFNKWQSLPTSQLLQGCKIYKDYVKVCFRIGDPPARAVPFELAQAELVPFETRLALKQQEVILAVDLGMNKLMSASNGLHYGREFKAVRDKILRRRPGSKNRKRARAERTHYVNRAVKALPWDKMSILVFEDLRGIKKGKSANRSKQFRRKAAPWVFTQVQTRADMTAQENGVLSCRVDPYKSSVECSKCGNHCRGNRKGERFVCSCCGHTADADTNAADNLFARTFRALGSLASPSPSKRKHPIAKRRGMLSKGKTIACAKA